MLGLLAGEQSFLTPSLGHGGMCCHPPHLFIARAYGVSAGRNGNHLWHNGFVLVYDVTFHFTKYRYLDSHLKECGHISDPKSHIQSSMVQLPSWPVDGALKPEQL